MLQQLFLALRQAFRQRRYRTLSDSLGLERQRGFFLDLGGGPASFFTALFPRPEQIILLDLSFDLVAEGQRRHPAINAVVANAEQLPFGDGSIGLTVCNSVIEHVERPAALAREIHRTSKAYFLQTPNGRFPLETHSLIGIPLYHLIPWAPLRALVCRLFRADFAYVESVRYCPEAQLRGLFPQATLSYERFLGLKKSFYLIYEATR